MNRQVRSLENYSRIKQPDTLFQFSG